MMTIKQIVDNHREYFSGEKKESDASLQVVEEALEIGLPSDLKWLLKSCGYGECSSVPNIQESIANTQRFREAASLPRRYIVLDDRNDAGAVLLDTESPAGMVLWVDTHALYDLNSGLPESSKCDIFPDFVSWVSYCIEEIRSERAT
jgi:hypothetical protein